MYPHSAPQLAHSRIIPLDELFLLLRPSTGAWLMVNGNGLAIAQSLTGKWTSDEVVHYWSEHFSVAEVRMILDALAQHGLLENSRYEQYALPALARPPLRPKLVVLHLTRNCNLACKYCCADTGWPDPKSGGMSAETAIRTVEEMLKLHRDGGERLTVVFHGGEPLLNWKVIQAVVEHPFATGAVQFQIQTNGVLLTRKHVNYFKKHNIQVGVSIDGPQPIHDAIRMRRNGKGSYRAIVKGIELLKKADVPMGAIVVLSRANWQDLTGIFDMLLDCGIHSVSVNPLFLAGRGAQNIELALSGDEIFTAYRALTQKIIHHNQNSGDEQRIEERTLKYLMRNIVRRDGAYMCMRTPCGAGSDTVAVDINGDVYLCDDFLRQTGFLLGNIYTESISNMLETSQCAKQYAARTLSDDPKCSTCDWRAFCGGLCPAHTYYEQKVGLTDQPECRFRQQMIPYLFQLLARGEASPELFNRQLRIGGGRKFYFNINYVCMNRCIFCASDLTFPQAHQTQLDAATLDALLTINQVGQGDQVVINGGEPTLSQYLPDMLLSISKVGAHSHLFTNGRRLCKGDYCRQMLAAGINHISIPIFGTNLEAHDSLTGAPGSFIQTVAGISNLLEARDEFKRHVTLEIKLLFFKPTLETNPCILRWIAQKFPAVDCVSLNGLIVSKVVFERWDELVATPAELSKSINATLDAARFDGLEALIRIHDIPFCLIDRRNLRFLPPLTHKPDNSIDYYFDPECLGGKPNSSEKTLVPSVCEPCIYVEQCSFIRRPYFNQWVAFQSVKAMFPEKVGRSHLNRKGL